jgi:hypothetical protein
MSDNELMNIAQNANVPAVREVLGGMFDALERSAAMAIAVAVDDANADLQEYSAIEQKAMLYTEMLNQTKAVDYASIMLKGRILDTIIVESLHAAHPAGYGTLEELAQDQDMSVSELSNILDLTRVILPWIETNLNMMPEQVFNEIGRSNLRELVPILKRVITLEEGRQSIDNAFERLWEGSIETLPATMDDLTNEDGELAGHHTQTVQRALVDQLLSDGMTLTNANLRQTIRPERTQSINAYLFRLPDGNKLLLSVLDDSQDEMMARRMHGYWDVGNMVVREHQPVRPIAQMRRMLRSIVNNFDLTDLEE